MTSKAKLKGNSFERDVAMMLNTLLDTQEFSRAPTSGAFFGKTNAFKKAGASEHAKLTLAGDLTTPANFRFTIECKNYAHTGGPNAYAVMEGRSDGTLDKWLAQVSDDGRFKNKIPCLFFKLTPKKGTYFCIPFDPKIIENLASYTKYQSSDKNQWLILNVSLLHLLK
jgi:hypothetical protein